MLKTGVGKDSAVNHKEWRQIGHLAHPSSEPPRALIRTPREETTGMIDYFESKVFSTQIAFKNILA